MKTFNQKKFLFIGFWMIFFSLHGQESAPPKNQPLHDLVKHIASLSVDSTNEYNVKSTINKIHESLRSIEGGDEVNSYRASLLFYLGYVYRNYGYAFDSNYLNTSAAHYEKALVYQPNDINTLRNLILVYQELGAGTESIGYLKRVMKLDPENEGLYNSLIGDIYSIEGSTDAAWSSYMRALHSEHPDPDAALKLIDLYDAYPSNTGVQFYKLCTELEEKGEPILARTGYSKILSSGMMGSSNQYFMREDEKLNEPVKESIKMLTDKEMEQVLLRWTAISAQKGLVTSAVFASAGLDSCDMKPVAQLRNVLRKTEYDGNTNFMRDNTPWWHADGMRLFYLNAFMKSFADYQVRTNNYKLAVVIYETALGDVWHRQDYSTSIYGASDVLMTDILIALAKIYNNPNSGVENKWPELESELFSEKGEFIALHDLANMQKFHTILGFIYVDQGKYTGTYAKNAEFQFERAINAAEERAAKNPKDYHPIPNIYLKLAMVYDTLKKFDQAADTYLKAAVDFLEVDHLKECDRVLKKISEVPANVSTERKQKLDLVKSIYSARSQVPNLDKDKFNPERSDYYEKDQNYQWLYEKANDKIISKDVMDRQRFKLLSDLSAQARNVGEKAASEKLSTEAKTEMKDIHVMTSKQDEVRTQQLEVKQTEYNYYAPSNQAKDNSVNPGPKEKSIYFTSPPGNEKQQMIIDKKSMKKNELIKG